MIIKNSNLDIFSLAEKKLVARALSELNYEGLIDLQLVHQDMRSHYSEYRFAHHDYSYTFKAYTSVWDFKVIQIESLKKFHLGTEIPISAFQFFKETQDILELDDITLAHFTEEMHQTLFADQQLLLKNRGFLIENFAKLSHHEKESYLFGHPKILLNKGRIGFSADDFKRYSPEFSPVFAINLLLVQKEKLVSTSESPDSILNYNQYLMELFFSSEELNRLKDEVKKLNLYLDNYQLFPVHPWQLEKVILLQFAEEISKNEIIVLKNDQLNPVYFSPQISVRTLRSTNVQIPFDFKLSMNILNTSAYRGMGQDAILSGHALSNLLSQVIEHDPFLRKSNISILKEIYGAALKQNDFGKISGAPYRYHELLSFILRENRNDDEPLMTGLLLHTDENNASYLSHLIRNSGVSAVHWLNLYAERIILPLYHLQLQYGIGLVAHGQNVLMTLENNLPGKLIIKDFQGDLRLSAPYHENLIKLCPKLNDHHELKKVKTLPSEYLIHDLITGHFVTHLRFLSAQLHLEDILPEKEFYMILAFAIENYLDHHHPNLDRQHPLSLLRQEFERVILNKVRFKMGYQDTHQRLLPLLGPTLKNPICASVYHD